MRRSWCGSIAAFVLLVCSLNAFAAYKPVFTWQIRGDANYQQGIYDGDNRIAVLDMSTLDEPMQALMFFSKVERPILLRHLVLTPGGKPLMSAVHLFWKSGNVITDVLDGLSVSGNGTDRLAVTFTVKDPNDVMKVERTVTVTYEAALNSYVYDIKDRAVVNSPEKLGKGGTVSFEICDPWYTGSPAPSQPFPGMWKGRYSKFAYESKGGGVVAIPHNHFSYSHKGGIELKRDGIFAAVFEPDGNPAFQVMGETADKTRISICPWGYDVHISYSAQASELSRPIATNFRFFQLPADRARTMDKSAVAPPLKPTDMQGLAEVPMYERVSSFEKPVVVGKSHEGNLDPWFWVPQGEKGAVWDRSSGRTGKSSLRIEKDTPGVAAWYSMCEGQGYFTEPWMPCKGYEISLWVKTKDVTGPGVSIGACYHVPNIPPAWPITFSEKITGTQDWKKVTLRLGQPQKDTSIMSLHLQQEGKGTVWFDDLEVKMIK
ncbi:MAG: carbohydrate binding domain-containing protein [Candidatus Latescibacterota bacterium]